MSDMYRLTNSQGEILSDADSIEYFRQLVAAFEPGHYVVEEMNTGAQPGAHPKRRWGTIFKLVDGTIKVEPDPE